MSAEEPIDALSLTGGAARPAGLARVYAALGRQLRFGTLLVRLPDGRADLYRGSCAGPAGEIAIDRPLRLLLRVLARGDIGFAESYLDADWRTPDLPGLLDVLQRNEPHLGAKGLSWSRWLDRLTHRLRDNHRAMSRRNIARHYDLGNDFYRLWLDPSMTYSAALFADRETESLEAAQARKYERLLDDLGAQPGQHILEIGCGWGGLAQAAARRGLHVTGVTLSREQLDYARARIAAAGFSDRVDLRLQDYRDIGGQFDHCVSIEMLEAVGEAYWPTYFQALRRLVRPGGRISLQVITINEDDFLRYRGSADFIQLYIFPGGMLPSPGRLQQHARAAGLIHREDRWYGPDYAETLRRWRRTFHDKAEQISALGYDARFRRMWDYYLAYCEVGFDNGVTDLVQAVYEVPNADSPAIRL
ncbi:cyclopropane-fatty-acyl-phospholipid synthase family protein [uncultured Thiodictyon sp.]|uniref:SAM-dependent methyltransferase n=1 Tax=uncultured Thiodictyon sp. TaxID=1846217 RepID=UPI0025F8791A|nr:cyclopropane-fatty-acyl-phospholipid synthase family protein [uncultured Thiodictyon sp.]